MGELAELGPGAAPALSEALGDDNSRVRKSAAEALGGIGPATKGAVPALIEALKDEDFDVRWTAGEALNWSAVRARRRSISPNPS